MTIYVRNVPRACGDSYAPERPFVLFGLWQYEHKSTVLHFAVQRNTEYDGSVRSKVRESPRVTRHGEKRRLKEAFT